MREVIERAIAGECEPLVKLSKKYHKVSRVRFDKYWLVVELTKNGKPINKVDSNGEPIGEVNKGITWSISPYRLIFDPSLGFVEALVKSVNKWKRETAYQLDVQCSGDCEDCGCIVCSHCDCTITEHDDDYYCHKETGEIYCETCFDAHIRTDYMSADYHRAQMSQKSVCPDIEALKQYLRKISGVEG